MTRIPILHVGEQGCYKTVMFFTGDPSDLIARAKDVEYLDGSTPFLCDRVPNCPFCKVQLWPGINLKRLDLLPESDKIKLEEVKNAGIN